MPWGGGWGRRAALLLQYPARGTGKLSQGQQWAGPAQHGPLISSCVIPMASCGNTGLRHQHDPSCKQDHGHQSPLRSAWSGRALRHQQGHKVWPRLWASVWPLVATWASIFNTESGFLSIFKSFPPSLSIRHPLKEVTIHSPHPRSRE